MFIRLVCEALGLRITPELSNFLTREDAIAATHMERKSSKDGKAQRNDLRTKRQDQCSAMYKKGIAEGTLQQPGAGRVQMSESEDSSDEEDEEDEETIVASSSSSSSSGTASNPIVFPLLIYETKKHKRELGVITLESLANC